VGRQDSLLATIALYAAGCVVLARLVFSRWGSLNARQRVQVGAYFPALAVFVVGVANCVVFFTVSVAIGGSAVCGRVELGHAGFRAGSRNVARVGLTARSNQVNIPTARRSGTPA
jgi:hypothetical protein